MIKKLEEKKNINNIILLIIYQIEWINKAKNTQQAKVIANIFFK